MTCCVCFRGSSSNLGKGTEQGRNQQSLNFVTIGGVIYRASEVKLMQSLTPKSTSNSEGSVAHHDVKSKCSHSSVTILHRRFSLCLI